MKKLSLITMTLVLSVIFAVASNATDIAALSADDYIYCESKAIQDGYFPEDNMEILQSVSLFTDTLDSDTIISIKNDIMSAWDSLAERIEFTKYGLSSDEFVNLLLPLYTETLDENPQYFYIDGSYQYSASAQIILIKYDYEKANIPSMITEFEAAVSKALECVDSSMGELDTLIALHDYLVLNAEYDVEAYENMNNPEYVADSSTFSAYGVLVNKIGVCQSYTLAYNHLLNQLGFETSTARSPEIKHIWNVVMLDESWYHIDVTHDDPITDRKGVSKYTYFLCSNSELAADLDYNGTPSHGSYWTSDHAADSDTYTNAFWKSSDSTMAYLDNTYYLVVRNIDNTDSLYSATLADLNESTLLRSVSNTSWGVSGSEDHYIGGKFHVIPFVYNDRLYYNNVDSIYRYCPGKDTDELVFNHGNDYGFIVPLPQTLTDSIKYIFAAYTIEGESQSFAYYDEYTANLDGGHNYISDVIDPTDTEYGYTLHTCSTCSDTYKDTYLSPLKYLPGDVDGDGVVNATDSVFLSRHLAKWAGYTALTYEINCDLNSDSKTDASDSVILSRYLAKWTGYGTLPLNP